MNRRRHHRMSARFGGAVKERLGRITGNETLRRSGAAQNEQAVLDQAGEEAERIFGPLHENPPPNTRTGERVSDDDT